MRAVRFDVCGPPEVLKLKEDVPLPKASAGRVLVAIKAAGVNPIDYKVRQGGLITGTSWDNSLIPKPKIPGGDLAGSINEDTGKFRKGQRVFALTEGFQPFTRQGTYAEYYAAKESDIAEMPASVSFQEAAGIPLASLTAYQALDAAQVKQGTRVLIHAGAGGVGSMAVQLAKARGAYVITTAGPRNIEFVVKELGADEAIDYTKDRFDDILQGKPVDAVIDAVGGDVEPRSFKVLKSRGHYQRILNEKVSVLSIVTRGMMGLLGIGPTYGLTMVAPNGAQLAKISDLISQGKVKPVVDRVYPLEQAAEAHAYLEQGHARGKVILNVQP